MITGLIYRLFFFFTSLPVEKQAEKMIKYVLENVFV